MSKKRGRQEFVDSLKPEYLQKEDCTSKKKKPNEDAPYMGERELERSSVSPRNTANLYKDLGKKDLNNPLSSETEFHDNSFMGMEVTYSDTQKALLAKIVELEALRMGIFTPEVKYKDMLDKGAYDHEIGTVWLNSNPNIYENLLDLVETAIHETRHCYQFCIIERPEAFSDIPNVLNEFLQKSYSDYPQEFETEEEWDAYIKNGLEIDSNAYARYMSSTYQQFTADVIHEMQNPPVNVVKNQILMTPSDISESGRIAPLFVPVDFDVSDYAEGDTKQTGNTKSKGGYSMAGQRSLNISDEKQREAIKFYEDVIKEIQSSSGVMANRLGELLKSNPYEQTQKAANAFLTYYNTTLPSEIEKAITEWRNSDNCISAAVKKMYGGEAAVQNAMSYEDHLIETVRNSFSAIDEFKVNVAGLNTTDQAINEMTQMIDSYMQRFETNADSWIRSLSSKEQEEMIYSCIHDVVSKTIVNVRGAFEGLHIIFNEVGIHFSEIHSSITGINIDKGQNSGAQKIDLKSKLLEIGHMSNLAGF